MYNLGVLLQRRLNPPELVEARRWYTLAAEAGHTDAMYNLGILLANQMDPPELRKARRLWTAAAEAGNTNASSTSGSVPATVEST